MRLTPDQWRALREAVAADNRDLVEKLIGHIVTQEVREELARRTVSYGDDRPFLACCR